MPFTCSEKYHYEKSQLRSVICQVRFPPILSVDASPPAIFQNDIRDKFPYFSEKLEQQTINNLNSKNIVFDGMLQSLKQANAWKNYEFLSESSKCKVNLTRTFLSLSSDEYSTWKDFYSKFSSILSIFIGVYKPSFFTRIGLRYIDIFNRNELGISEQPWNALIRGEFIGFLSNELHDRVISFQSIQELKLKDDDKKVRIASSSVFAQPENENCIMLDCDFSSSAKTTFISMESCLQYLHSQANGVLQKAILKPLHDAMQPVSV